MGKKKLGPSNENIYTTIAGISNGVRKGYFDLIKLTDGVPKRLVGDDVRYQCQKCGDCCRKGFSIELSIDEMDYLSKEHPEVKTIFAYREGDKVHPFFNTGPGCNLLQKDLCSDYRNRPFECKFFPFHLEEVNSDIPGSFKFGKKYYQLFVYENCKGLDQGEVWTERKLNGFVNQMLRGYAEHSGMLRVTYSTLTTNEFFEGRKRYGSGVLYGTDDEIREFIKDYRSKFYDEE